jgi:hypothetical protein
MRENFGIIADEAPEQALRRSAFGAPLNQSGSMLKRIP